MTPPRRSRAASILAALGVGAAAYLLLWPVPIEPQAWDPPAPPPLEGVLAPNDRLAGVEVVGIDAAGPEAIAIDAEGRIHTGTRDGRILRLDPATLSFQELARTGGRPLGMAFHGAGVVVCDAVKGLLELAPTGELRTLATGHGGVPFGFTDDVDAGPDGTFYFSDASARYGPGQYREDILEHGGHGRLLSYRPDTGRVDALLSGLHFANGVAVSGDGTYVLVNETGAYRVMRYWLAGPRKGAAEPFVENLPGFPDNVTWSAGRRAFWVALFAPRMATLDALGPMPLLRKVVLRLPAIVQPRPVRRAWAIAVDEEGNVLESLMDDGAGAYAPITSVRERDGVLWLGSLERDGIGRVTAPPLPAHGG